MQTDISTNDTSVSVVIPTYNRAHTITRALESVLGQTHRPTEIIVVDDGSSDNTLQILTKFKDVTVLSQKNQGVSAARNTGISHSSSTWIALLDSDDEWLPEKLQSQLALLTRNPESRICHCDEIWIRNGRRINPANKHKKSGGWIYPDCLPLCAISPSAVMIHRDVFEKIGMFDTNLPACEDYDMWLRICSRWPVSFIDRHLLKKYGGHDDQLSKRYAAMDRFRITALQKILRSKKLSDKHYQLTLTILQTKLVIYLNGLYKRGRRSEANEVLKKVSDLVPPAHLHTQLSLREPTNGQTAV